MNTTPDQLRRPPITESPWFWLALFGGVGLLGVMVIGPKWVLRTARIERMQGTRERVAAERAQRNDGNAGSGIAAPVEPAQPERVPGEAPRDFEHEPYLPSDQGPPLKLVGLSGIMIVLMLTGVGGLLATRHRGTASNSSLPDSPGAASL
ncbi:MAG: hypothetical protein C0483_06535 [Pirellula sp.]|nr:hypothetical protein [Pirellula sp.]